MARLTEAGRAATTLSEAAALCPAPRQGRWIMRLSRRRTAAAVALAVPLGFLPAAPAMADSSGSVRIAGCSVERGNVGDPVLTAKVIADNTDDEEHDYKVNVKFSQNGSTVGEAEAQWVMQVRANGVSPPTDATTYDVSGNFDQQAGVGCEITAATDEDGDYVTIGGADRGSGTAPDTGESRYTVARGDTLWGIAEQYYGDASEWRRIYDANRQTIEDAAQQHGRVSSDHGHWIFPGTQLVIP